MSRELKFRAWDNKNKKLVSFENIELPYSENVNLDGQIEGLLDRGIILMQFTGLYDTNKIEIYEGDYMLDGHSGRWGEVKYIKGAFVVDFDGEYQDLYDWTNECVIGNIYENPDMLEYI